MALTAVVVVLLAAAGIGETSRNAVADTLAEQGLLLGIDFSVGDSKAPHPTDERRKAYQRAGFGAWMTAQIEEGSDGIGEPPAAMTEYLAENRAAVWSTIAALEKGSPDWGAQPADQPPKLLRSLALQRLLLAVALVETRDGNAMDAERALEASWSLGRPLAEDDLLISQLLAINDGRWQAGILRKTKQPSLIWMGRLGNDGPWRRMLDAVQADPKRSAAARGSSASMDELTEVFVASSRAIAEGLRKVSPCDLAGLTDEDLWKLVERELGPTGSELKRSVRDLYEKNFLPNLGQMVRRAARAAVDRETTLRIVELRLEKEGSRDGKWPSEPGNAQSVVCPGASYNYRSDGESMEIRFDGSVIVPEGPVLPLVFRSGPPPKAPTPTPPPPLTLLLDGGMIPQS